MWNKFCFAFFCVLLFLDGMLFGVNIDPYVDSAHYQRHWTKAAIAVAVASMFAVMIWQKARKSK